jgi:cytochrome c peroxidase
MRTLPLLSLPVLAGLAAACSTAPSEEPTAPRAEQPPEPKAEAPTALTPVEQLGKALFFDQALSSNGTQSCAACHGPEVGFTGPVEAVNGHLVVYEGAEKDHFGNRKPPAAAYAGASPALSYDADEDVWTGGMFWDGRADGTTLGDPLAEQAMGPFLNPLEQAIPDAAAFCALVSAASYAPLFREVWGADSLDCAADAVRVHQNAGRAIAAYERSTEVNPFSSRYDAFLAGEETFTEQEKLGLELFEGKGECADCHPSQPGPDGQPPLFTDFSYDNLGVPLNTENPFLGMGPEYNPDGAAWRDPGLGAFLEARGEPQERVDAAMGLMKVPTLRNVARGPRADFVKAYCHNGYFRSLDAVVHFYNTRDTLPACAEGEGTAGSDCWPAPESAANVNTEELGDLGLTPDEEAAIVAFMGTLSDR